MAEISDINVYEVYQSETTGEFLWRKKGGNGEIIGRSEGYTEKASAKRAVKRDAGKNDYVLHDLT